MAPYPEYPAARSARYWAAAACPIAESESVPGAAVPAAPRRAAAVPVLGLVAEVAEAAEVEAVPEEAVVEELAVVGVAAEVEEALPVELLRRGCSLAAAEAPPAATPDRPVDSAKTAQASAHRAARCCPVQAGVPVAVRASWPSTWLIAAGWGRLRFGFPRHH